MPGSRTEPARSGPARILRWLPVAYLLLAQFPFVADTARPGLDGSWVVGVNELIGSPYHFGRDVVYTYGPLGFLLAPLQVGHNPALAEAFWLTVYALLAACVWRVRRTVASDGVNWIFALGFTAAVALLNGLLGEYQLLIYFALTLLLSTHGARSWWLPFAAGVLAATFFFIKTSLGATALLMAAGVLLVEWLRNRGRALRPTSLIAAGFAAAFLAWSILLLRSFPALRLWLRASRDIAGEYSVAQSVNGKPEFLVLGVLGLVVVERLLEGEFLARARLTVPVALGALLAFKHGFTRQDRHVLSFFPFVLGLIALLYVFSPEARRRRHAVIAFFCVLALGLPVLAEYDPQAVSDAARELAGWTGMQHLRSLARFPAVGERLLEAGRRGLEPDRLDPRKLDRIRTEGGKVTVMPWEVSLVPANQLDWQPTWALQSYVAHTVWLDQNNAASLSRENGPPWLLLNYTDVDDRNLLQSAPLTMRAVLENYDLADSADRAGWLLLRKRAAGAPMAMKRLEGSRARSGAWIEVPRSDSLVLVGLDLRLNPLGRAARIFFRVPPVRLDLELEGGGAYSCRLVPGTAASGIPIGTVVRTSEEFQALLRGRPGPRVVRFRVTGDGAHYYRSTIGLTWMEVAGWCGQRSATGG